MIAHQNKLYMIILGKIKRYNKLFVTIEYNTRPILLCDLERDIFRMTDYQIIIDGTVLTTIHELEKDRDIIKVLYEKAYLHKGVIIEGTLPSLAFASS